MEKFITKISSILIYSFCLVGITLFWTDFAESLFFDPSWWKEFHITGSLMLYGIVLFSIYSFLEEKGFSNYLTELLIEFGIFIAQYLIFGWIFKWYTIKTWWAMPIQCLPVFIAVYFLRLHHIKRDLKFINSRLKKNGTL